MKAGHREIQHVQNNQPIAIVTHNSTPVLNDTSIENHVSNLLPAEIGR
jgi:hypothetical protein